MLIERSLSLYDAESKIDDFYKGKGIILKIERFGTLLSNTVATLKSTDKSLEGSGKGYELEALVGAKYEAYEHNFGLKYLKDHQLIYSFNKVQQQQNFKNFLPLEILDKCHPKNMAVIGFDAQKYLNGYDLYFPLFLTDHTYAHNQHPNDDCQYQHARRYSCSTGLAAGFGFTEAAIHAVSEVIERHSVGCFLARNFFYQSPQLNRKVDPAILPDTLVKLLDDAQSCLNDEVVLIDISFDSLKPVYIAYCKSKMLIGKINLFGSGCSIYPSHAATRAIKELVQHHCCAEGTKFAKKAWRSHYDHLVKYPKLLRSMVADMSQKVTVSVPMPEDPAPITLDEQLKNLLKTCKSAGTPVWVKELKEENNGISLAFAAMPNMERFSVVILGNYVIPTRKDLYEK